MRKEVYYTGNIVPEDDVIFVFGSNPEGRHGAGSARVALNQFGAIYGQGEGKPKTNVNDYTTKNTSFRGDGTDIFICVPYSSDKTKYAILTMSSSRVQNIEKNPDAIEFRKARWNYYKATLDDKSIRRLKYWNKITDANTCNFNVCVDIAHNKQTPLLLNNAQYSPNYGMEY